MKKLVLFASVPSAPEILDFNSTWIEYESPFINTTDEHECHQTFTRLLCRKLKYSSKTTTFMYYTSHKSLKKHGLLESVIHLTRVAVNTLTTMP